MKSNSGIQVSSFTKKQHKRGIFHYNTENTWEYCHVFHCWQCVVYFLCLPLSLYNTCDILPSLCHVLNTVNFDYIAPLRSLIHYTFFVFSYWSASVGDEKRQERKLCKAAFMSCHVMSPKLPEEMCFSSSSVTQINTNTHLLFLCCVNVRQTKQRRCRIRYLQFESIKTKPGTSSDDEMLGGRKLYVTEV